MQVEGIGQYDAVEGLIGAVGSPTAVKRLFNVDGRDVVGEQDDLVGMKLSVVLPCEIGVQDQRGLEQPDEEDAGAGERVEDMNALVAQAAAELLAHFIHRIFGGIGNSRTTCVGGKHWHMHRTRYGQPNPGLSSSSTATSNTCWHK